LSNLRFKNYAVDLYEDTVLINSLVSQLSVEPNVDMDTGFANGHVVGDIHTAKGSLSPLSDIYIVPSVVKYVGG
jgi:hypothetical protein